jgi:hypothetical protein
VTTISCDLHKYVCTGGPPHILYHRLAHSLHMPTMS